MDSIRFENVSKSFGKTKIINNLNLSIEKGERLILLGPSGCGKSTILRMISGLETITTGNLYLNGKLANDVDSGDRDIAMVFQNYALYPHMTIEENVGYGLRIHKEKKDVIRQRVKEAIDILNLTGLEGRYVKLEDTLRSFETILGGELDKYPEAAFSNVGNVDEVIAKAKKMGAV